MSDVRQLWFESHLLTDPTGRAARRRCDALGADRHSAILGMGDRLAQFSAAAAQQFYRVAASGYETFGPEFELWVDLGMGLAEGEPSMREATVAYFSVPPEVAGRVGLHGMLQWTDLIRRIAHASRKLAAIFAESTAALVTDIDMPILEAWVDEGLRLHGKYGWHGEFLAQAFIAAAPSALPLLSRPHFPLWAGLGAALRRVMKETDFYRSLPSLIRPWSDEEKTAYLQTCLALAVDAPKIGAAFYLNGPESMRSLPADLRTPLLRACARTARPAPTALGELIPVLGAIVHSLPAVSRLAAIDLTVAVADRFPVGVPSLLRSLPKAFEEAPSEGVRRWVERGLDLAATNLQTALAFFALESRTSLKVLHASSTGAALEDVQGFLRKFVQMLSGQPVVVRSTSSFRLRPALEEFPAENEVALPLRIDCLSTYEENERLFRLLGAILAGRREFGTYDASPGKPDPEAPPGSALSLYLNDEERPALVEELFRFADGFRVACRVMAAYPGLTAEFRWAAIELLQLWTQSVEPGNDLVFDCLLAAAVLDTRDCPALPEWLDKLGMVIIPCLAPLAFPSASAADALTVAERLAMLLLESGVQHRVHPDQFEFGGLLLEKAAADALIDPYLDEEDDTPFSAEAPHVAPAPTTDDANEAPEDVRLQLDPDADDAEHGARPMSIEELRQLLESGVDLKITQGHAEDIDGIGLYISDLLGKLPAEQIEELRRLLGDGESTSKRTVRRWLDNRADRPVFLYDEWDYHIADYRPRWCKLLEIGLEGDSGVFFNQTLIEYADVIPEIRRQFQRIRPEMYRVVRGLEDGEDFDLNAVVNARVETRARRSPSPKLYVARKREERDVATLFLLDMSASTDEPLVRPLVSTMDGEPAPKRRGFHPSQSRRIIDVTKEALVIMAEALEEIGDAYAIYGFSGHGRDNVEFYLAKSFGEQLTTAVKSRIGGIEPKRSTRMGTALRHAIEKMATVNSASKYLILLSDGFPQDFDYGQDRRSNVYGIRDTTMALREAEAAGITPFCITVDKAGHDYLREMCDASRYMVIEDISALPSELPKIYQRVVRTS